MMRHDDTFHLSLKAPCAMLLIASMSLLAFPSRAEAEQGFFEKVSNTCLFPFRKGFAQGPKRACITDTQCGTAQRCDGGYCQMIPPEESAEGDGFEYTPTSQRQPGEDEVASTLTTEEECDADRRCRIDRLRRKNNARRYQTLLEEEDRALRLQKDVTRRQVEVKPRSARPFALDFYASFGLGVAASYLLRERLRVEALATFIPYAYVDGGSQTVDGVTTYSDGDLSGWNVGGAVTYLFRTKVWSPYVSGAVLFHRGSYYSYSYSFDGFGGDTSSDVQSVIHLLEGRFGFDVQFKRGFRTRLGVLYRYPIYTLAKFGPGDYDTTRTEALDSWIKGPRRIAPEFSIGWAF